jgi:hypothetical protein
MLSNSMDNMLLRFLDGTDKVKVMNFGLLRILGVLIGVKMAM